MVENRDFFIPLALDAPVWEVSVGVLPSRLVWSGYPMVKNFDDIFSRFDEIPPCDRQPDGRIDGRTDILSRHSPRYAYPSGSKL